jgi:hypothetical protein
MSKIMRQMYAEARAAREAAANANAPRIHDMLMASRNPVTLKTSRLACWPFRCRTPLHRQRLTLQWWATRIDMARLRFMPAPADRGTPTGVTSQPTAQTEAS